LNDAIHRAMNLLRPSEISPTAVRLDGYRRQDAARTGGHERTQDGIRLASKPQEDVHMYPVAALLVVLTLAGTPVAALACVALCGQAPQVSSQAICHEEPAPGSGGSSLSGHHTCDTVPPNVTFVPNLGSRVLDAPLRHAAAVQPVLGIPALGRGWVEPVRRPETPLPVGNASHVILRI
jgi:hypothetical protein